MKQVSSSDVITDFHGNILGQWDGEHIGDLLSLIMSVEDEQLSILMNNLPHQYQIPEALRDEDLQVWACDKRGLCLVGQGFNQIEHATVLQERIEQKMICTQPPENVIRFELKTLYSPMGTPIGYCFENNQDVHTIITNYDGDGIPTCEEAVYWSCFDYAGNEIVSGEAENLAAALATFYRSDKIFAQINEAIVH